MRHLQNSTAFGAIAAFLSLSAPAFAADVYNDRTPTDAYQAPSTSAPVETRSGFYIKGDLGIANGDRDIRGSVAGSKNELYEVDEDGIVLNDDGDPVRADDDLNPAFPHALGSSVFTDVLKWGDSDDFDATVLGGELSYLYHMPNKRFGIEIGLGGTFYTDNETSVEYGGKPTVTSVNPDFVFPYPEVGNPNIYSQEGTATFERDYDIDLVAKGHLFVSNRLSVYAGGGVSWAQASLRNAHTSDYFDGNRVITSAGDGVFDNAFKQDEDSFGYVLTAGLQYWVADNVTLGVDYSYKVHEFEFSGSAASDAGVLGTTYRYGVSDKIDVEDELHTIKARLGFKLN